MKKKKNAIRNKNKKPSEAMFYYFCAFLESDGDVYPLLLTKDELQRAKRRAEKNKEDVPSSFLIFQYIDGTLKKVNSESLDQA
jgi:hypothetical protein